MCDGEGNLGDPDAAKRQTAVENHYKWVEAARFLGCHTIRVNGYSSGTPDEQMKLVADGMRKLSEFADGHDINVVIENHGGLSSNGKWLSRLSNARTKCPARCRIWQLRSAAPGATTLDARRELRRVCGRSGNDAARERFQRQAPSGNPTATSDLT